MRVPSRCVWLLVVPGLALPSVGFGQESVRLSGVNTFVCDGTGRFDEANYWNTVTGDTAADVFVVEGDIDGPLLNGGSTRSVSLSLTPGENRFTLLCDAGREGDAFGINLYLEGRRYQLSAFTQPRASLQDPIPRFEPDPSVVYGGGELGTSSFTVNGVGLVELEHEGLVVELTEFWWARKSVFSLDRVGKVTPRPDGSHEHVGQIVLTVSRRAPDTRFLRGDVDDNGRIDISDPIRLLDFLFSGSTINCLESSDADNDGQLEITDAIGLLGFLFLGTFAPADPFPVCGVDDGEESPSCESYAHCQ